MEDTEGQLYPRASAIAFQLGSRPVSTSFLCYAPQTSTATIIEKTHHIHLSVVSPSVATDWLYIFFAHMCIFILFSILFSSYLLLLSFAPYILQVFIPLHWLFLIEGESLGVISIVSLNLVWKWTSRKPKSTKTKG